MLASSTISIIIAANLGSGQGQGYATESGATGLDAVWILLAGLAVFALKNPRDTMWWSIPLSSLLAPRCSSKFLSSLFDLACSLYSTMPCLPNFYPCPGHEDILSHDATAQCLYYAVAVGRNCGVFTNAWIARDHTDGYSDPVTKSFRTWDDMLEWWERVCLKNHSNGCPVIKNPLPFTLDPDGNTHPGPNPCTHHTLLLPLPPPRPPELRFRNRRYRSPAASRPHAAPSPFNNHARIKTEPLSPVPKKEEPRTPNLAPLTVPRISPLTRVQLSPTGFAHAAQLNVVATGRAHADALNSAAAATAAVHAHAFRSSNTHPSPSPSAASVSPSPTGMPVRPRATVLVTPATPATPARTVTTENTPSVLVTPGPNVAPPRPPVAPAPPLRQYGIHGVSVFYATHAEALAAVWRLGLSTSKIMVSDNVEKLEAWMTGAPFVGED
ncbi:hypothetical protein DFH07DRAFT_972398 [Mycena maculata]|uniref:Ribonuclease H1 N-terminal domain-containing protein n=1 Tax=Mycena maculata TaxID=230809 RepID=A0AAD7MKA8_9AGAR|nr:hypothetical protein DFH07DRAFT_972398 [Mycena maculata]